MQQVMRIVTTNAQISPCLVERVNSFPSCFPPEKRLTSKNFVWGIEKIHFSQDNIKFVRGDHKNNFPWTILFRELFREGPKINPSPQTPIFMFGGTDRNYFCPGNPSNTNFLVRGEKKLISPGQPPEPPGSHPNLFWGDSGGPSPSF